MHGPVESESYEVAGASPTQLRVATVREVAGSYVGIRIVLGDPLDLF